MFDPENKNYKRIAASTKRVVIADPNPASARMLSGILREVAQPHVYVASTVEKALSISRSADPQVIFTELTADGFNGLDLVRRLRRSEFGCRKAPVILVTGAATASAILAARDAGVHEVLRKPFSLKDLVRRLEAVMLRDRDWVEALNYVGPDRRRFNSAEYDGPLKRQCDGDETPRQARIHDALRILKATMADVGADPGQTLRVLLAQATTLQSLASEFDLSLAASELFRHASLAVQRGGGVSKQEVADWIEPLLAFLPETKGKRRAA